MQRPESSAIEAFIPTLPDPAGARSFLTRLRSLDFAPKLDHDTDQPLLARLLTIAAYSPYLGETLLRHPEHISWLERESSRGLDRVKSTEQLREEMARYLTGAVERDLPTNLARFKRRELLRIYLRDCLARATLAEVTDELSNLADVILGHALAIAQQEMINRFGAPQIRDERGRIEQAELAVVSLGKLGCRELNYASDVDLLFLFSGDGFTAGDGRYEESSISNKTFFAGVADRIVQLIGSNSGEGSVYRIDLRLRPYGRDGDTVWEIERAADYYREKAQHWERQALIRARASAGSERVVSRFLELVRDVVFAPDALPGAVASVRRAKEKIDRSVASRGGGFNVKLGRGGIREIEFIAQALQLARGGREPWVRSAQTLIVLGRLAEKHYLSETECARLSAAYEFLRKVEHRLQMEHGAQTHRLPASRGRLELLARRCGYRQSDDPELFLAQLEAHTTSVRAIYDRVFATADNPEISTTHESAGEVAASVLEPDEETARLTRRANIALNKLIETRGEATPGELNGRSEIDDAIKSALPSTINPPRALRNLTAWAESLATYQGDLPSWSSAARDWQALIKQLLVVLSSPYLSNILVSRPALATVLVEQDDRTEPSDLGRAIRMATDLESGLSAKSDALRRVWCRFVIKMGYRDMAGIGDRWPVVDGRWSAASDQPSATTPGGLSSTARDSGLRASNVDQTALAEAVLSIAVEIALESIGVTPESLPATGHRPPVTNNQPPTTGHRPPATSLPFAILGLGRLGHSGMDYGSDLDLLVVFDDKAPWPPPALVASGSDGTVMSFPSPNEFYAKLTSQLVLVLSSITREGLLYRIDLRLRPEGKSGSLAQGLASLTDYLGTRASAWEHSAYLKAREVTGDLEFGARARTAICNSCFDAAQRNPGLRKDLSAMRTRLEKEKGSSSQRDIKWGTGGMTEVYFITRYIQLRDRIYFPTERGTTALIKHLGELGAIDESSTRILFEGYWFLRSVDHWIRLLMDRARPVLPASAVAMGIARALGLASVEELEQTLARHKSEIRGVYDRVFG